MTRLRGFHIILCLVGIVGMMSCRKGQQQQDFLGKVTDLPQDTLNVGMCYSPTGWGKRMSGEWEGYDYELIYQFAHDSKMPIRIIPYSYPKALYALHHGKIDLVAHPCIMTLDNRESMLFVPMQEVGELVLVQREGKSALTNAAQLNQAKIMVRNNSIAHQHAMRLNEEIGGGMRIGILHDSVSTDSIIGGILHDKWDMSIMHLYEAAVYKKKYPHLNIGLKVSAKQSCGWAMKDSALCNAITQWRDTNRGRMKLLHRVYFEQAHLVCGQKLPKELSPYDAYFQERAPRIQWDWELLASLCYHESRFNPLTISPAGACGLMQLMPITARRFGLNDTTLFDPESNIAAGVEYIKYLNMIYNKIEDKDERIKFILASYNAGPAHVLDAMRLAEKYGRNPHVWYNNVEYYLLKKNNPEYYTAPEVRFGRFNGRPTCAYVTNVISTYQEWCHLE